jgi:hypothetical protein
VGDPADPAQAAAGRQALSDRLAVVGQAATAAQQAAAALRTAHDEIEARLRPIASAASNAARTHADPAALITDTAAQLAALASELDSGPLARARSAIQATVAAVNALSTPPSSSDDTQNADPAQHDPHKALRTGIGKLLQAGDTACTQATAAVMRRDRP